MPAVRPFDGYFVDPAWANEVVSPAYDSLTPAERHQFALANPRNYLNAMRSLEEFPEDACPELCELLASNATTLKRFIDDGAFVHQPRRCLYFYRMEFDRAVQTGVVGEVSIREYDEGELKIHEHTRSDREDRLVRYLEVVGAASSPVCLAYRQSDAIDAIVDELAAAPPALELGADDGVLHTVWRIDDEEGIAALVDLFAAVPSAYLTDGHHRSAAASRYAAQRRAGNPDHSAGESYERLLVALFPHDQLHIHPYNRCVKDLDGHSAEAFLDELAKRFHVEALPSEHRAVVEPGERGQFGMRLDEAWYRLTVRAGLIPAEDPAASLDVNILQGLLLEPALGITDPRSDPRLDYVPGNLEPATLERLRGTGWRLAFASYPASIEELMAVVDAGEVMPPKSTFFAPKLRSGIFLCLR